jgi:general secretion pathway protein G
MSSPDAPLRGLVRRRPRPARGAGGRAAGFTLIEIMAVVLIMGFLAGIVGVAIIGQIDRARVTTAEAQIKQLESALAFYQMDNGRFPTTEQGLEALVRPPTTGPQARNYRPGGYLQGGQVPLDPWGNPFQYESPGRVNTTSFDLWSFGADGSPGGEGVDADIGNWPANLDR